LAKLFDKLDSSEQGPKRLQLKVPWLILNSPTVYLLSANCHILNGKNLPMTQVSKESIQRQAQMAPNWKGTCDRMSSIPKPTLILTGTDDVTSPPANSLMLVQKIPGAWLVQIKGGGHGAMYQYPEEFSKVLLTFLDTTYNLSLGVRSKKRYTTHIATTL
jgi:pimeloyl-ACP methyl ester carboxylesterase